MCRGAVPWFLTLFIIFVSVKITVSHPKYIPGSVKENLKVYQDKDDGKSSLVFVFDTTGSMYNDLRQLREGAEMIMDTALEDSKIIADFVFVPFHDPGIGPATVTKRKAVFKAALNIVRVYGGGDCPEKSLGGIQLALNVSRPRSFVYVFTDATASDHRLVGNVLDMVQRKQSQVVFVLTGHCNDLQKPSYLVYQQIAAASNGQVFNLNKTSVHKVLDFVKSSIRGRNVNLGSSVNPAGYNHTQEIPVDSTLGEVTVSVSGAKPSIKVVDPKGEEITGPPKLITTLDLSEIMVVKVMQPEPGNWTITVGSEEEYSVKVVGLSNLTFNHGFSVLPPKGMQETSYRPLKSTYNHLMISLTQPDAPATIDYAEILDLSGKTLFEVPLEEVVNGNKTYVAKPLIPPDDFFYIAINGHDGDNQELRRIGATAVQAKLPDVPYLTAPRKVEARYHERVVLTCGVESLVPVTAMWTHDSVRIQPQISSLQTTSIDYVIEDMSPEHAGSYRCVATNAAGQSVANTEIELIVDPPQVNLSPGNKTLLFGEQLAISCEVFSEALLSSMQMIFKGIIDTDVTEINVEPNLEGLYSYNKTIPYVDESHNGIYTCVASNSAGQTKSSMNIIVLAEPIVQILGPHSIKKLAHSDLQLSCHVENAERMQWLAPNNTVVMENAVNGSYDGMFEVKNVTGGPWTCVGLRGAYRVTDAIDVDILIKPSAVIDGSKNITIMNGTTHEITCIVTAKPMPRIIWHRETESFLNHTVTPLKDDVYKSVLKLNSSEGSIEATYFCIGENSEGISEDSVVVNVRRKMTLIEGFTDKSVEIYSQVDLHCQVDSHPPPHMTWYHNGTVLVPDNNVQVSDDGTVMYVLMVDFDNLGEYSCEADNGYEKFRVNGILNVKGLESPVLSKEPAKTISREGESTTLTCRVLQGKPEPSLTWQYKSSSSDKFIDLPWAVELSDDGTNLTIPSVVVDNDGTYQCLAENVVGIDAYEVQLVVQYAPRLLETTNETDTDKKPVNIEAGDKVTFSCKAVGIPPPVVVWTKDRRPLAFTNNVYLTNTNDLVIEKANEFDSGMYTCNATSALGSSQKNFTLFVYVRPKISPPLVEPAPDVAEGQLVEFPCRASGVPRPGVRWLRDGDVVTDRRKFIDEFGIRFVANVTDFGNYTCHVENNFGNASVSFPLYVWVPPSIHHLELSKEVVIGSNATLQCDAMGFPLPNILWEFRDEVLIENTTDLSFNDIGNLFIKNTSTKHEGTYACIAENIAGIDKKFITLHVNERPKILDQDFRGSYVATNMDTELLIACKASGKPKPYVLWRKDGLFLDNDGTYNIDFDGTLTIKSPTEELSGLYVCLAKNTVGEINKTVSVEIYSLPTQMQSEESHTKVSVVEGTNTSIDCPIPASQKDLVKWYKGAKLISEGQLQISNVSRHNSTNYACVVANVAGSAYSSVDLDVEWPPRFGTNATTDVEVVKGNDWFFDCGVDAKPRAKTKWLFNSKPMIFEDKDRLKLLNVQLRHTGVYKCVVSNKHGAVSRQFTLDVLVPPIISEFDLLDVQLKEGTNATLECNAKGSPQPDLKWTFNNSNWQVQKSSLVSTNLSVASEGLYRCDATNKAGAAYIAYRVSVVAAAKVEEVVMYAQEASTVDKVAEVVQGTRVRISCKASGKPTPKVQWIRNGEAISENAESISYADLALEDVQLSDAGVYVCVASNEGGVGEEKIRLEVLEPPKIFQTLFQGNSTNEVNLEVLSGQSFYLHCHPYGNPLPEVYWFKDGLPLRLFDDSMISTDYGEVIEARKATFEQSGNYTCVARNRIGNTSLVYLVDVMVPPPVPKESAKIVTTRVGKPLNLTCPAEGRPLPAAMWLRHPYTEIGDATPRVTLVNDNFSMIIANTEVTDSGKYSCIMTNKVGTTEVVFDVTIEMPPTIAGNAHEMGVENHVVPLMRSLVLTCEVKGNPTPKISWLKDTQRLSDELSNIQHIQGNSLLAIWSASTRDAGQYICVAENSAGTAHRRYNVAVRVPGKWSGWSAWGFCNATCGAGHQHRARRCGYQDDAGAYYDKNTKSDKIILDESECKGPANDKRKCHMPPCEDQISSRWSPWSKWWPCTATCGAGTQARMRTCRGPQPCYGDNVQIRKCPNLPKCEPTSEKREIEYFSSREETTETDSYLPEATYEMHPEVMNREDSTDVEEFYSKTAPKPSAVYDVNVTRNLDFSESGPCQPGYRHNDTTNTCDDIDECTIEYNQCHATQLCVNTQGGYRCTCSPGFSSLGAGQRCLDINECEQETSGCEYACVNVAGGYVCACPRHLRLHLDKHHCVSPSSYRQPFAFEQLESGDYLSASFELPRRRSARN
ncbi:hypothetical protein ABMA28_003107 [Loxostege sticticalis]|uniref:Hemolin n=1 Tax=Loxostege sticticalis TaxID=481309 RepID=A0ABD0SZF2_LOXSC